MMGVDNEQDEKRIFELTNIMIGADDPDMQTSSEEGTNAAIEIYTMGMALAERYRNDARDKNLTTRLLHTEVEGEHLTEDEFCRFFLLLLVAGNETTRTVTSNGMRLLMEHPDQLQMLVDDPSLIPQAIEECLRFAPAVIQFRRTAMEDIELRGQQIKKGDKVVMYYASANRDEDIFPDSDKFDILRKNNDHRAFGIGEHFCLGAHLARLELNAIFHEIITRLHKPRFAGPVKRLRSNFINGVKEMRIEFEPEK
jgi:cytochrome P450